MFAVNRNHFAFEFLQRNFLTKYNTFVHKHNNKQFPLTVAKLNERWDSKNVDQWHGIMRSVFPNNLPSFHGLWHCEYLLQSNQITRKRMKKKKTVASICALWSAWQRMHLWNANELQSRQTRAMYSNKWLNIKKNIESSSFVNRFWAYFCRNWNKDRQK